MVTILKADDAQQHLCSLGSPEQAANLARFFKTGPGQYGEGDQFIGVKVPVIRKVAKEFTSLPLTEAEYLLHSAIHEERLLALGPVRERLPSSVRNQGTALSFEPRWFPVWDRVGSSGRCERPLMPP